MTYALVRIIVVTLGTFFGIGYYADALPYRHGAPPFRRRGIRWTMVAAIICTFAVAAGVVGWPQ